MINCHYCQWLLPIQPKFVLHDRNSGVINPVSTQIIECQTCKAIYSVEIEITKPTKLAPKELERIKNKPVE